MAKKTAETSITAKTDVFPDKQEIQLVPQSMLKSDFNDEQMDRSSKTPSEIVHMTNTIVQRQLKTETMDDISQSSVTTIPHHIQFREHGLKRETTDVYQSSYMKPEIHSEANEVRIKPEVMVGASCDTQHVLIKEANKHTYKE